MKREKFYIIRKSVPVSPWKANLTQENVVAQNLNQVIEKAITPDEIKRGVRIVAIFSSNDGIYFEKMKSF